MINIKVTVIRISVVLFLLTLIECSAVYNITDNYIIHSEDDAGKGFYLTCNPGCDYDAFIENVKSISWDKRHLLVEQAEISITKWYLIIARGDELRCCNRDTVVGPFSEHELQVFIKNNHINLQNMRTKTW